MTTWREAAQQALEAMRCGVPTGKITLYEWDKALSDLDAALAQQAEPQPVLQGPVRIKPGSYTLGATCVGGGGGSGGVGAQPQQAEPVDTDCHTQGICQRSGYGITQQAEPVEPVAIVRWNDIGHISWRTQVMLPDNTPLYTAPPKRKPLTEEEIQAAWDSVDMRHPRGNETRIAFARAVERAHGIGRQTDPQIEDRLARHGIPKP